MFFYLISLIMLSRLYSLFRDESVTVSRLIIMMVIQLILLILLNLTLELFLVIAVLLIVDLTEYYLEKKSNRLNLIRFIIFLFFLIVSLVFSLNSYLSFNSGLLLTIRDSFSNYNPVINLSPEGLHFIIIITGILFLLNEANFFIRLVFEITGRVPVTGETLETDKKELNAGRIIGILERLIIFFFVAIGQFAAVGFVIAAKSVVRYRELENRNFAEYVLIGTLLSSLLAILTGFAVSRLLI